MFLVLTDSVVEVVTCRSRWIHQWHVETLSSRSTLQSCSALNSCPRYLAPLRMLMHYEIVIVDTSCHSFWKQSPSLRGQNNSPMHSATSLNSSHSLYWIIFFYGTYHFWEGSLSFSDTINVKRLITLEMHVDIIIGEYMNLVQNALKVEARKAGNFLK